MSSRESSFYRVPMIAVNAITVFLISLAVLQGEAREQLTWVGRLALPLSLSLVIGFGAFVFLVLWAYFSRPAAPRKLVSEKTLATFFFVLAAIEAASNLLYKYRLPGLISLGFIDYFFLGLAISFKPRLGILLALLYCPSITILGVALGHGGSIGIFWAFVFNILGRAFFGVPKAESSTESGRENSISRSSSMSSSTVIRPMPSSPSRESQQKSRSTSSCQEELSAANVAHSASASALSDEGSEDEIEKRAYATVADEMDLDCIDRSVWTKAYAEALGDEAKTKAAYIRLRVHEFVNEAKRKRKEAAENQERLAVDELSERRLLKGLVTSSSRYKTVGAIFEEADSLKGHDARFHLSLMYLLGKFVKRNSHLALKWLEAAAVAGNKRAGALIKSPGFDVFNPSASSMGELLRDSVRASDEWAACVIAEQCPKAINESDDLGFTAMHVVASSDNRRIAETLIRMGGDLNKPHRFGKTPREIADQKGSRIFFSDADISEATPSFAEQSPVSKALLAPVSKSFDESAALIRIAKEIEGRQVDQTLWSKALAEARGNSTAQIVYYVRFRLAEEMSQQAAQVEHLEVIAGRS